MCRWDHECYMCSCPLDVYHLIENMNMRWACRKFDEYCLLNPIFMDNNTTMYKFFGLTLKRVCTSCFKNKKVFTIETHHQRQKGVIVPRRVSSKTKEDIFQWCQAFNRYLSRPEGT